MTFKFDNKTIHFNYRQLRHQTSLLKTDQTEMAEHEN